MANKDDVFANIAKQGMDFEGKGLVEPTPAKISAPVLQTQIHDAAAIFEPYEKLDTPEKLKKELAVRRDWAKPYMRDFAPPMPDSRKRLELAEFDWRLETEEDAQNFETVLSGKGDWERVQIPHYGGPVGIATAYYRTEFDVEDAKGYPFLCFRGVDYKAHVFLNGNYLGSHEGFFAPFSFACGDALKTGKNILVVQVENDYSFGAGGDKVYAATGLGFDEPQLGWHHCPPGMGIYHDVFLEFREEIHINDIYVRPLPEQEEAEVWVELFCCNRGQFDVSLNLSLYGQNFQEVVFENLCVRPTSIMQVGMGDSLTEARRRSDGSLHNEIPLFMQRGINYIKTRIAVKGCRIWDLDTPWLYQVQVALDYQGKILDRQKCQFGMRSFQMREQDGKQGCLFLNGRRIRLHGANTMGHEQQCVLKKDWNQLRDDILLAKICNMNFLRLTQRPVQDEIYQYCDRLGLMVQTDLPLFGALRRNQFCEVLRQVEEMEKLVRSHPCCVITSYINEPFPNANNQPQRFLTREELQSFFECADRIIHLHNPDRVIKHVDGDYDPPGPSIPDNHCYCGWYNGHGLDIGKLHKGYWLPVRKGWYHGCGEYGAEGLDPLNVMECYPASWLPSSAEEEKDWSPNSIISAQTGRFHYFFYETPHSLADWIEESQRYQALETKLMTTAFRRDNDMITFAIHLFIDAFPSGWMKTIMDCKRQPKQAYFTYRDCLTPLLVNIRSDRFTLFEGEELTAECWICNDYDQAFADYTLHYQIEDENGVVFASAITTDIPAFQSNCQGVLKYHLPSVNKRTQFILRLALTDETGRRIHETMEYFTVFPKLPLTYSNHAVCIGERVQRFAEQMSMPVVALEELKCGDVIMIDSYAGYDECREMIDRAVSDTGATALFLELEQGEYSIVGSDVRIRPCGMMPLHFVSRDSGHPLVRDFTPYDFRYWYSSQEDRITPILYHTIDKNDLQPVLLTGNMNDGGEWVQALAAGDKKIGNGRIRMCQVNLIDRTDKNPVAQEFAYRLLTE